MKNMKWLSSGLVLLVCRLVGTAEAANSAGLVSLPVSAGSALCAPGAETSKDHPVARDNVVWTTPSKDYNGSMPIGNGDLAANVWVEPTGDLIFYLSKSDSWTGGGPDPELVKLGRVRVTLNPSLYVNGATFKQELDLKSGVIRIQSAIGNQQSAIQFWIDANRPVVHVDIQSSVACTAEIALESWRADGKLIRGGAQKDVILPSDGQTVRWYQRNVHSIFADSFKEQHLGDLLDKFHDPLINRTFGGLISGEGLKAKDHKALVTSVPTRSLHVMIHALTEQTKTPEDWLARLARQRQSMEAVPIEVAWSAHVKWWQAFWDRSYIDVSGTPDAEATGLAYQLQRWVQACAGRGNYPIKFNGSLFTVDGMDNYQKFPAGEYYGPDHRRWGGPYWFQNTRLIYWPMLYSGDYDQMAPFFSMYRNMLPLLKERTYRYFGHQGVFFSETTQIWGLNRNCDFGKGNPDFYPTCAYMKYYWDGGLELSTMMLAYYQNTEDAVFVRDTLLPIADQVVLFYDQHYKRTQEGKLHIWPSQVIETWHDAEDPITVIAGLRTVLAGLLALPTSLTTDQQRARWQRLLGEVKELPAAEEAGKKWLKPAYVYSNKRNAENPELYAVFPYPIYGVGKPALEVGRETYARRANKRTGGWQQDSIQAALLGLTEQAVTTENLMGGANEKANRPDSRFPAFWGPNFDWIPDQCQASVILNTLQYMLMQVDGITIRLLPAWPKDWNASFKLHAPYKTTVEGRVVNGEILDLKITPESRRKDVIVIRCCRKRPHMFVGCWR
jgi:alpha-L-fucosidase 2